MKFATLKKSLLYIIIFLILVYFATKVFIDSQVKHQNGLNTPVVDISQFNISDAPVAITNISVLSTDSSEMLDNQTVLIKNGLISKIGSELQVPGDYTKVDGSGKFLIPGLADTHAHTYNSKNDLLLYIVNGVTQIAILSSHPEMLEWRKDAKNGAISPQIFLSTGGLNSKYGFMSVVRSWFGSHPGINTAEQAREAVEIYKEQGFDVIKAYEYLNRESYFAMVEEAKKQHFPVSGHIPEEVTLDEIYHSGQSHLAHVEELVKGSMRQYNALDNRKNLSYLQYLNNNADDIAKKVKAGNISISTTVWLMESLPQQRFDLENFLKTIELEYENPGVIEGSVFASGWLPGSNRYESQVRDLSTEDREISRQFTDEYVQAIYIMTKALVDNDVILLAGSDSNTAGTIAGFSMHDEFQSLSNAGLSNSQILHSATLAPSKWMGFNSGQIAEGMRADLVILDNNPLLDIKNTRSINAVILNGKLMTREVLDDILSQIKKANNSAREISIEQYL
ncbi:MAG TPA: amidohydrolase family protein [Gammaproteobacteria bacterium]|nr:amidohydrolase family protein [Xanthomonadales bacterium]HOP22405.1 amidohydrolase family protein [Gammaproteobacteria bacterium]HPI96213.1 amidohydrolase family protein [Gammaproteobacteria bacterium]HPQ88228.1 amidohydrolase family protein [Gammaproteobacteria bacterium]